MSGRDMDSVNLVMNRKFNEYLGQEEKINKSPLYPIVHPSSSYLCCSCYSTSLVSSLAPGSLLADWRTPGNGNRINQNICKEITRKSYLTIFLNLR